MLSDEKQGKKYHENILLRKYVKEVNEHGGADIKG
jgi:hypothetical protein